MMSLESQRVYQSLLLVCFVCNVKRLKRMRLEAEEEQQ